MGLRPWVFTHPLPFQLIARRGVSLVRGIFGNIWAWPRAVSRVIHEVEGKRRLFFAIFGTHLSFHQCLGYKPEFGEECLAAVVAVELDMML